MLNTHQSMNEVGLKKIVGLMGKKFGTLMKLAKPTKMIVSDNIKLSFSQKDL